MIPDTFMQNVLKKYKKVFVLFDNDDAGKQSAERYGSKYSLPIIDFNLSKDIADALRDHSVDKVREEVFLLLKQAL
jgi:DNA primase